MLVLDDRFQLRILDLGVVFRTTLGKYIREGTSGSGIQFLERCLDFFDGMGAGEDQGLESLWGVTPVGGFHWMNCSDETLEVRL